MRHTRTWGVTGAVLLAVAALGACSSGTSSGPASQEPGHPAPAATSPAPRPSSPAKLKILSPRNGQVVTGDARLKVSLTGAKIVNLTSTTVRPDQGHIHVLVDGKVVSMTYGLDGPSTKTSLMAC